MATHTIPNVTTSLLNTPYDAAFFDSQSDGSLQSARAIVPLVVHLLNPQSVVDFGCGVGTWLRAFMENGVEDVLGIDGDYVDRNRLRIDRAKFRAMDLTRPQSLGRAFDLALCLEVAEHLPTRAAPALVALLTAAAPVVLFSAAVPGQGGTNHLNEQWPAFWQRLFARHDFVRLDPFRYRIVFDQRIEPCYRQNILLFASKKAIFASGPLQEEQARAEQSGWELVVPLRFFLNCTTFTGLLKQLPSAGWRAIKNRLAGHI